MIETDNSGVQCPLATLQMSLTTISGKARVHAFGRMSMTPEKEMVCVRRPNMFSRLYDSQYDERAKRNANRISAFHLVWTVLICMKSELDEELTERGKFLGDLKKWSKKTDEEFEHYRGIIDRQIIKADLPLLAEDYEELDTKLRDACNIEQKTVISFGRLLHCMTYLLAFTEVMKECFNSVLDYSDVYCRKLGDSANMLSKSAHKYVTEAGKAIKIHEIPLSENQFMEMMKGFMIKH